MKSEDKFDVRTEHMYGKEWVRIVFKGNAKGDWIPSFEDLRRIILPIAEVEDRKYPRGEGRIMVQRFLAAACNPYLTWEELQSRFLIPNREIVKIRRCG